MAKESLAVLGEEKDKLLFPKETGYLLMTRQMIPTRLGHSHPGQDNGSELSPVLPELCTPKEAPWLLVTLRPQSRHSPAASFGGDAFVPGCCKGHLPRVLQSDCDRGR